MTAPLFHPSGLLSFKNDSMFASNGLLDFSNADLEADRAAEAALEAERAELEGLMAGKDKGKARFEPDFDFGFDEEPSDFEDDVRAALEAEDMEDSASSKPTQQARIDSVAAERRRRAVQANQTTESRQFVPSLLLEPVASSSRLELTPPPELSFEPAYNAAGQLLLPLEAETASGSTVSFRRRAKPRAPLDLREGATQSFDLLTTPLHKLLAEADELRSREKALELEREFSAPVGKDKAKLKGTMWVDKYRPKRFSDLLGEDRVHREVMAWLKEWDKCVFKRAAPKKRKYGLEEEDVYFDALGRPRERILLLSGAPGYGKTTLAHIVAKHAGYRTLEINASDDRNAATVTSRIKNAIDAGSGLGSEGRPTCVVIDEIDGASGGGDTSFVRSLIKLIQDEPARKKTKTPAKPLRRPIICICNDLYAPALRPLRPYARIVRFRKPASQFIVQRLRDICDREKLSADLRVLTSLVDLTGGDVRSCLNTLQFIKARASSVSADAIKSSSVGSKDAGTTLQSVWTALFVTLGAKQRRKQVVDGKELGDGKYVDRLAHLVQASGEHERVVQGAFEHYPNLKPLDASWTNITRLHDWLAHYDGLNRKIGDSMEWELLAYVPYAVVPWHAHFASASNASRGVEWPKQDYEAYQARLGNEEIATSLKASVPPTLRSLFSSTTTLTELIPLLVRVISPPLKPVNAHIVKAGERAVLARLVELMLPLGLRFWQDKTEDGQPMMRLEPAIDVFVHYDGKRAGDIGASRFAVRQLISQAMDAESARRRGVGAEQSTAQGLAEQYAAKSGQAKAKPVAEAEVPTDFFGRVRVPVAVERSDGGSGEIAGEGAGTGADARAKFRAVYRFNEGSSSAVRKNVKMAAVM